MLKVNMGRQWRPWPNDPHAAVLLDPLPVKKMRKLQAEATRTEGKGRNERQIFDASKYQDLVATHCIHGLRGFVQADAEGKPAGELQYTPEVALGLMDVDAFNAFVFREAQTMGLEQTGELEKAGNA